MSLRSQVGLGVALLALLVVASSTGLAYGWFVRQQSVELRRLLTEDVARVAALLDAPVLGAAFVDPATPGFAVQVVGSDGRVVLAWGRDEPLPLAPEPTLVGLDGRRHLVASAQWRDAGGTIRVAHDIEAAMRTRADLARSLGWGGALAFLSSTLVALVVARRSLRPLELVAERARAVDPEAPETIAYPGRSHEVRALTDALNATLTAIRERSRRERAFLLEIAHELAAPLTLVNYHLAALRRERPADAELVSAADAAQELLHTSQDLLVLARGELDRPLDLALVDLRDLLERVAGEFPGVRCDAAEPAQVIGDGDRLMQVARNLVRNGVQAAGGPRGVRVTLAAGTDEHLLRVEDDGPGLDDEALARVFERGFRRGRGSGVGLTISKDLVEQHGGRITAASGADGGARFEVWLPSLASRVDADVTDADVTDADAAEGGA
ncbi:MAG: HAMP domain-containing sensor histidine kinase [Trueperaceae bacterium]